MKAPTFGGILLVGAVVVMIGQLGSREPPGEHLPGEDNGAHQITVADFDNAAPLPRLAQDEIARAVSLSPWQDVCSAGDDAFGYCGDVGKEALNCCGGLKGYSVGWVVGVSWRPVGTLISRPDADVRTASRAAFYFIILDVSGGDYVFLREAREISPR